jgi:hypothetical protein
MPTKSIEDELESFSMRMGMDDGWMLELELEAFKQKTLPSHSPSLPQFFVYAKKVHKLKRSKRQLIAQSTQ